MTGSRRQGAPGWQLEPPSSRATYIARELAVSSVNNAAIGGLLLNPLNVARARLQLQAQLRPGSYTGVLDCLRAVARTDGVLALWRYGVLLSTLRETSYGGAQWGLYGPLKVLIDGGASARNGDVAGGNSVATKIAAGLCAGAIASAAVTPIDLVMVKQFVQSGQVDAIRGIYTSGLCKGQPRAPGTLDAYKSIYKKEGFTGLYRGWGPNTFRAACITASLTASYDQTKEVAMHFSLSEGPFLHIIASITSGLTASVACAPMDLIKARVMAAPEQYPTAWSAAVSTFRTDGARGFYVGTTANIMRLCPAIIIQMPIMEEMRRLAGLGYFGS